MADYNSAYTGAEIDANIGKVAGADTTPTSGSTDMITSGAVYTANQAALTAAAAAQATADAALPKSGGTLTGNLDVNNNSLSNVGNVTMSTGSRIANLTTATDAQTSYASNVAYVLAKISAGFAQFAAAVRAVTLDGLSTATNSAITATDTVLVALGKLQAQINAGGGGGGTIGGTIAATQIPYATTTDTIAGESGFTYNTTDNILNVDNIQLNGGTGTDATLTWNDTEKTIEFPVNSNVTLQIGQEELTYVKASEDILNGEVVYASGAVGASGVIEVTKFIANNSIDELYVLGVATEDILTGEFGFITTFGKVRGLDTSAFVDGDILYASPSTAGALTTTKPTAPNLAIPVAMVINSHAVNGVLFVRPISGLHLDELHDVLITSISDGQLIKWDNANTRWINFTPNYAPTVDPTFTGTLTAAAIKGYRPTSTQTGTTYTFALGDANTMIYADNASAQTYTVPPNSDVAFPIDTEIEVFNDGAGLVTFAEGSGVTINSKGNLLSMSDQYTAAILKKQATDTWILIGDLA